MIPAIWLMELELLDQRLASISGSAANATATESSNSDLELVGLLPHTVIIKAVFIKPIVFTSLLLEQAIDCKQKLTDLSKSNG